MGRSGSLLGCVLRGWLGGGGMAYPEDLEGTHKPWDGDEEPEPGLREFRIIVGEVRGATPVCELRCPECASPDLVMLLFGEHRADSFDGKPPRNHHGTFGRQCPVRENPIRM